MKKKKKNYGTKTHIITHTFNELINYARNSKLFLVTKRAFKREFFSKKESPFLVVSKKLFKKSRKYRDYMIYISLFLNTVFP